MKLFDPKQYLNNVAFFQEDGSRITYSELDERVRSFQQRFRRGRGLLLLEADNSLGTMVAYLAALQARCPVALVEPGAPARTAAIRSRFSFLYHYVGPSDTLAISSADPREEPHPSLALLLSTSGSTGAAKYVCLSFDNIVASARSIAQYLDLSPGDRAPTNLPFYYSYGLSVVNSHLVAGGSIFLTNMSVMDAPFWQRFDQLECTSFAGVPHTYEMLQKIGFVSADRKSLRYCTQAGGKLSKALVLDNADRARKEGWKFFVMYGQTEAAPRMAYLPPDRVLDHPECIGLPIPGGSFHLEDENGAAIGQVDTPGDLVYSGPNVMMGYACEHADLVDPVGDKALRTGDVACRNREGLYYIVGRKSRFLKMFGLRVSLDSVEDHLSKSGVRAICGGTDGALRILAAGAVDTAQVASSVAAWLGMPAFVVAVFEAQELPLQANGKVDYQRANAMLDAAHKARSSSEQSQELASDGFLAGHPSENERKLAAILRNATGQPLSDLSATIRDSGADSLSIVQIRLDLDEHIVQVPDNWIDLPIRELASRFSTRKEPLLRRLVALKGIDAFIAFRALAIVLVVSNHFHWFSVPGGSTTLLFVIGGYLYYETVGAAISTAGRVSNLWTSLVIVVATLLPMSVLQAIVHTLVGSNWHITLLLPYENLSAFINDRMGWADTRHHVEWLWFIHVYLQVFAAMALALSFARVRRFFADRTYEKMFGCFVTAEVLGAALILADSTRVDLGHSAALLQYAPTTILPVVLFGVLIALTKTRLQFTATILAGASYAALYAAGVFTQGSITTLATVVFLLFMKTVKVPGALLRPIMMVSEASLFIYLTHMPFQFGIQKLLKWDVSPALLTTMAIVVSVGLWQVWRSLLVNRIRGLKYFARVPATA